MAELDDRLIRSMGTTREALDRFQREFQGFLVFPGMLDYEPGRRGNPLYPACPKIIAYCQGFRDVELCLKWARTHDCPVTCRSGGHSMAGYSVNDGLVIDVSRMNYVSVDPVLKQARVGAGATSGILDAALSPYGLHVPGAACGRVGIAGYMQGGGYGFTSREFGMNCDSVLEVTVMLSDGRVVVANSTKNRDLYWAVRGGTGGNFGVLLEIRYQLHDLGDLWGFCLKWPIGEAPRVLLELQDGYTKFGATRRLGHQHFLTTLEHEPTLLILGMFHGVRSEGFDSIASLRSLNSPSLLFDMVGSHAELNEALVRILPGVPASPGATTFELKESGYIEEPLSLEDWSRVTEYFCTAPNPYDIVGIEAFGGAINALPVRETAFIHRNVYMDFQIVAFWQDRWDHNDEAGAREWMAGYLRLMRPYFSGHVYQNYPVRGFSNFRWAYWGDAFNSLLFVKQKYDPTDFFHFEQSIAPYPDAERDTITRSTAPSMFTDPTIEYEPSSSRFVA